MIFRRTTGSFLRRLIIFCLTVMLLGCSVLSSAVCVQAAPDSESRAVIVLDPGHTAVMSGGTEPVGPGSKEMKAKDTSGTRGVSSGMREYELTLLICFKLTNELRRRGYKVVLTRDRHDLSLSCIERAQIANNAQADAFIRVHADGSESRSARGAMTICTTSRSPYCPQLYPESRRLSDCVLGSYCSVTGAKNRGVWETDTMTGNNWAMVPTTLIELGFMTNPEEDLLMASEDYQELIVQGIADGIDAFFAAGVLKESIRKIPADLVQ